MHERSRRSTTTRCRVHGDADAWGTDCSRDVVAGHVASNPTARRSSTSTATHDRGAQYDDALRSHRVGARVDRSRARRHASRSSFPTARWCTRRSSAHEKAGSSPSGIGHGPANARSRTWSTKTGATASSRTPSTAVDRSSALADDLRAAARSIDHIVTLIGSAAAASAVMVHGTAASPVDRRPRTDGRGARSERPVPAQLDVGHDRPAEVRHAEPEPVVLLPPARGRGGRADRRRRVHERGARAVRLRPVDRALHARRSSARPCVVLDRFDAERDARG